MHFFSLALLLSLTMENESPFYVSTTKHCAVPLNGKNLSLYAFQGKRLAYASFPRGIFYSTTVRKPYYACTNDSFLMPLLTTRQSGCTIIVASGISFKLFPSVQKMCVYAGADCDEDVEKECFPYADGTYTVYTYFSIVTMHRFEQVNFVWSKNAHL